VSRQIPITWRIQIVGFERDHVEATLGIEILDEAPYRAPVVASTIYKYVPTPGNHTIVAHRIGPRICEFYHNQRHSHTMARRVAWQAAP
jgi:hypothetical protein